MPTLIMEHWDTARGPTMRGQSTASGNSAAIPLLFADSPAVKWFDRLAAAVLCTPER
jgi:hypothetical protein